MLEIKARVVLAILSFFLFFIAQMNRVNINIAIVAMEDIHFGNNWDAKVIVLGAYFWCYSLIELPGTFFLRKYGCRKILAINVFLCGLGSFVFPMTFEYHPLCGILIRALQGLLLGFTWPAIAVMSGKWIPRNERSKFISTYQGSSVGTSVTYGLGGIIIYHLGWKYLFYLTGVLSLIWVVFWWLCAYDSPAEHPRISEEERTYIEKELGDTSNSNQPVPWKYLLTSKPFWAVFLATTSIMWFVVSFAIQLPTFLHDVFMFNVMASGLLLCVPDIFSYIFSLSFSILMDRLIRNETLSITNARKFATIFSHIVPALLLLFLRVVTSATSAIVLIIMACAAGGATSSGNLANIVDISPRNAGIIMGISKTMCIFPGVLTPIIVKYFTADDPGNWLPVFSITSVILISTSIFYFIFGSGEVQPWDNINEKEIEMIHIESKALMEKKEKEMMEKKEKETVKFDDEIGGP